MDTACSLALLQEEVLVSSSSSTGRKEETNWFVKPTMQGVEMPLPPPPPPSKVHQAQGPEEKKSLSTLDTQLYQDLLLMTEWLLCWLTEKLKACATSERWNPSYKLSTTVPLHLVEEMWALVKEGEEVECGSKCSGVSE